MPTDPAYQPHPVQVGSGVLPTHTQTAGGGPAQKFLVGPETTSLNTSASGVTDIVFGHNTVGTGASRWSFIGYTVGSFIGLGKAVLSHFTSGKLTPLTERLAARPLAQRQALFDAIEPIAHADGKIEVAERAALMVLQDGLGLTASPAPTSAGPVKHFNALPRSVRDRLAALFCSPRRRPTPRYGRMTSLLGILLSLAGLAFFGATLAALAFERNGFLFAVVVGLASGLGYFGLLSPGLLSLQRVLRHRVQTGVEFVLGAGNAHTLYSPRVSFYRIITIRGPAFVEAEKVDGWWTPSGWIEVVEFGTAHLNIKPWKRSKSVKSTHTRGKKHITTTYTGVGGANSSSRTTWSRGSRPKRPYTPSSSSCWPSPRSSWIWRPRSMPTSAQA